MSALLPPLLAFSSALLLTPLVRALARRIGSIANPASDRWHQQPTALLGGVAIFAGVVVGTLPLLSAFWHSADRRPLGIAVASVVMFLVGLGDDRYNFRPATKLIFQGLAAACVITAGVLYQVSPWPIVNVLVTFFWFLGLTNAVNLLDNMDGVAAGVCAIAAAFLAVSFAMDGALLLSGLCAALAGALLGFLPYNFNPASIFMGDSGSLFTGSLLAGLAAAYPGTASASVVSVLFIPAAIVLIPILDTLLVTVARTLAGRSVAVGGRDHTSHRLAAMGLSQRQVALFLYAFAALGGLISILLRESSVGVGLTTGAVVLVVSLVAFAYLGKLHTYEASVLPPGRAAVLVSNLLHKRRAFEVMLDLILFAVAYQAAYLFRWDGVVPPDQSAIFVRTLALAVVAKSLAFGLLGVYRSDWHQLNVADAHRIAVAAVAGTLATMATLAFLLPAGGFSRGVVLLDGILAMMLAMGVRMSYRSFDRISGSIAPTRAPTLIYGAGKAGQAVAREIAGNSLLGLRTVAFIDDDPHKRGRLVHGYPVIGGISELRSAVHARGVRTIVVGTKGLRREIFEELQRSCQELDIPLFELRLDLRPVAMSDSQLIHDVSFRAI